MKNLLIRYGRKPEEAFVEMLRFTAMIVFTIGLAIYSPLFQLTLVLVPAFYTALTFRNGILFSILSFVISILAFAFISESYSLLFFFGILSSMGIIVGESNYRKNNMMLSIMMGAMVIVINMVAMIYIQNKISGIDFVEYLLNNYFALLEENGMNDMIRMNMNELKSTIRITLPAVIMSMGISMGILNYFISGRIVNRMGKGLHIFRSFWEFTLPGSALIAIFVSIIGIGIGELVSGYSAEIMLANMKVLYSTLFFIQGLSIIDFLALRRFKPVVRSLFFLILIFTVFTYPFLATIGALDLVFNIRRLKK